MRLVKENNEILYTHRIEGTDDLDYIVYKPKKHHEIFNAKLPKEKQKWIRPTFPDFSKLTKKECADLFKREIRRIKHGVYVWMNGELIYIHGSHYFGLVHWKLKESTSDYMIYSETQRDIFYFFDICVKDPKCVGGIVFSLKRLGKSELMQIEMFADALLSDSGLYIIQALNDDEAADIFTKTHFANERLHESLPIWNYKYLKSEPPPENLVALKRNSTIDSIVWKSTDGIESDTISFMQKPTKLSGIQGKKIRRVAFDEFVSLEPVREMTLANWHSKAVAQCTEDFGARVLGKIWEVATAENINSKSLEAAQDIYYDSDETKKDENGSTKSMMKRMFIPYYLGGRGSDFIDEYGKPKIEKAKKFYYAKLEGLSDHARLLYRRQNPETIADVFAPIDGGALEADVVAVLVNREKELLEEKPKKRLVDVSFYNGEVIFIDTKKTGQLTIEIYEEVLPHVLYRIGVDGTATDEASSNTVVKKSDFSFVAYRISGDNPYIDVANYSERPERRDLCEKVSMWTAMYYNKYGNCKVYPERNASVGSTLRRLFEVNNQIKLFFAQFKVHNVDNPKFIKGDKSNFAVGIYMDGNMKTTRTSTMNEFIRLFGHKINSLRIVRNLLVYGSKNADLADAYGVMTMSCGNFNPEKAAKAEKPKAKTFLLEWKMINGENTEVWVEQK